MRCRVSGAAKSHGLCDGDASRALCRGGDHLAAWPLKRSALQNPKKKPNNVPTFSHRHLLLSTQKMELRKGVTVGISFVVPLFVFVGAKLLGVCGRYGIRLHTTSSCTFAVSRIPENVFVWWRLRKKWVAPLHFGHCSMPPAEAVRRPQPSGRGRSKEPADGDLVPGGRRGGRERRCCCEAASERGSAAVSEVFGLVWFDFAHACFSLRS